MTSTEKHTLPWPSELRLSAGKECLTVAFLDGSAAKLSAEFLRVSSPSAEAKGHSRAERRLIAGKRAVTIAKLDPIGNYAIRIEFSDGHNTGIFSWAYLHDLALRQDHLWCAYLEELTAAGLARDFEGVR